MKKGFILVAFVFVGGFCYSQDYEGWLNLGISWGNQWESSGSSIIKTYLSSFAIDLGSYNFRLNKNVGSFQHVSFYFPRTGTIEANGTKITIDLSSNYDFIMGIDEILGVGFRSNINEQILLNFGIGPKFGVLFATNKYTRMLAFFLGIGGDMGFKFNITDLISISLGSTISYSFLNYTVGSNSFAKNYSLLDVKPYICLSLNRFYDSDNKQHWGKRAKEQE